MRQTYRYQHGLLLLCKLLPKDAVGIEIGSYAGESARLFMKSGQVKTLYCIDPWDPNYYSGQQLVVAEQHFQQVMDDYPAQVIKCKGPSTQWIPELKRRGIVPDFVYIDGNHKRPFVLQDIGLALDILPKGGIICGHDYGHKKSPDVKPAVRQLLGYIDAGFCDSSWMKVIV